MSGQFCTLAMFCIRWHPCLYFGIHGIFGHPCLYFGTPPIMDTPMWGPGLHSSVPPQPDRWPKLPRRRSCATMHCTALQLLHSLHYALHKKHKNIQNHKTQTNKVQTTSTHLPKLARRRSCTALHWRSGDTSCITMQFGKV